jgi:dephospho-CoA kinase
MGAFAILNMPKIESLLIKGDVVGDGLYSWMEYKILKEKYGEQLIVVAVYAPPRLRYERLAKRKLEQNDKSMRYRSFTPAEARSRDFAEIEVSDKGGPIAMADYTLVNTGSREDLLHQFDQAMSEIELKYINN